MSSTIAEFGTFSRSGDESSERLYIGAPLDTWARSSWLVVVDMQRAFLESRSRWCTVGGGRALVALGGLVAAFGYRVVHTRFVPPVTPSGSWVEYYNGFWPFALDPANADLWSLGVPWGVRACVDSGRFSKWEALLEYWGATPRGVVVCGVATDVCVLATCLAAVDDAVPVMLVEDACAASTRAAHGRGVDWLRARRGQVGVCQAVDLLDAFSGTACSEAGGA